MPRRSFGIAIMQEVADGSRTRTVLVTSRGGGSRRLSYRHRNQTGATALPTDTAPVSFYLGQLVPALLGLGSARDHWSTRTCLFGVCARGLYRLLLSEATSAVPQGSTSNGETTRRRQLFRGANPRPTVASASATTASAAAVGGRVRAFVPSFMPASPPPVAARPYEDPQTLMHSPVKATVADRAYPIVPSRKGDLAAAACQLYPDGFDAVLDLVRLQPRCPCVARQGRRTRRLADRSRR